MQSSLWNDQIVAPEKVKKKPNFNYKRDSKRNQKKDKKKYNARDDCQSPPYAVVPILKHLPENAVIWEPAVGEGYLAEALRKKGFKVITSGLKENFFQYEPDEHWDIIVTNPPWSLALLWMQRCFYFEKPWNVLLKTEVCGTGGFADLHEYWGIELIQPSPRIDYKMPNAGWDGAGSQFPSMWFTYEMNVGEAFSTARIGKEKKAFQDWLKAGGDPMQFCLF